MRSDEGWKYRRTREGTLWKEMGVSRYEARNVQNRVNCYGHTGGMERRLQESSLHWAIQGRGNSAFK